ncbi:GtrA family protein [Nocardia sp. alder85J]|uniref:GtrA family protein n=1 Tax=Nocardia sp. alder85J TaxID=2862949 RepID=UPI001CD28AF1|nr:GtrA family protein [Nocardia sp. alder85J]MCX4093844.1 GtrA family protein [Nocardia sp. alder85J]
MSSSESVTGTTARAEDGPPAATAPAPGGLSATLRRSAAFLVVGGIGFVVDAGTYNLLVFAGGKGVLYHAPLLAKIIAIVTATVVTYFGNKWWTYGQRGGGSARQYVLYALFNVIAIGLQLGCLGFSRYVLELSSPLSDNVSGTLIGQALAVVFRYWAYGAFVFTTTGRESGAADPAPAGPATNH